MSAPLSLHRFLKGSHRFSVREGERLIRQGLVRVNGVVVERPEARVDPAVDRVEVGGQPIEAPAPAAAHGLPAVWLLHKPVGVVCTRADEKGRQTIYDLLPPGFGYVFSVGRLDLMSEGALLLTQDGDLARRLMDPRFDVPKTYRVKLRGHPSDQTLARLAQGVELDGLRTRPCRITIERRGTHDTWTTWVLTEGKNRQIRRMCELVDLGIARLQRAAIGPVALGNLAVGELRRLTDDEVLRLMGKRSPAPAGGREREATGRRGAASGRQAAPSGGARGGGRGGGADAPKGAHPGGTLGGPRRGRCRKGDE